MRGRALLALLSGVNSISHRLPRAMLQAPRAGLGAGRACFACVRLVRRCNQVAPSSCDLSNFFIPHRLRTARHVDTTIEVSM